MITRQIFCCTCAKTVDARLMKGFEAVPHRREFRNAPFWVCDTCRDCVGCHSVGSGATTEDRLRPLGDIAPAKLREYRKIIHGLIDGLWRKRFIDRWELLRRLSEEIGVKPFTPANLKSIAQAEKTIEVLDRIRKEIRDKRRSKTAE